MYYQMNEDFLAHYGVLGMKWGRRKQKSSNKSTSSDKKISRKEYKNIVKSNKKKLQYNKSAWFSAKNEAARKVIEAENKQAIKNINDARVKRGKKKVQSIMYNLPGTLV